MACTLPASPVSFRTRPSILLGSAIWGSQFLLRSSYIHIIANAVPSAWNALPSFQGNLPSRQTAYHSSRQLKDHLLYVFTLIHLVGVSYSPLLCPNCLFACLFSLYCGPQWQRSCPLHFCTPSAQYYAFHEPNMCLCVSRSAVSDSDSRDCSPPGFFSVHEISQARLDGVAISFSRGSPDPGIEPTSPTLAGEFFTTDPQGKP